MNRRIALLAFLLTLAMTSHAIAQQCVTQRVSCGSSTAARIENSGCRYSNDADWPLASYFIDVVSGDVLDIFVSSTQFRPYVRVVRDKDNQIVGQDDGITIAEVKYDVLLTGRYRIVVSGAEPARTSVYQLDVFCSRVCRAPFPASPVGVYNVSPGGRATITANSDGTPALHYRWYDNTNPATTIGEDSATITTPPLFTNSSYWVEVSNACGKTSMFAAFITVNGTCEAPRITDISKDQTVRAGGATTLFVTAEGTRPFTYEWYEGTQLRGTNATLTVTDVQSPRTFTVKVSNGCGAVTSGPITVSASGRRRAVR